MTQNEIFWLGFGFLVGAVPVSLLWWLTYRDMARIIKHRTFWL